MTVVSFALRAEPPAARASWPVPAPREWGHAPAPPQPDAAAALAFLAEGLNSLAHGVALLELDSRLVYANLAARTLFAQAGWQVGDATLHSPRPGEVEQWRSALRQVAVHRRRQLFELAIDDGAQFVALSPVVVAGVARVFATCGRRELCGLPELQLYATRRGLTGAENQVLVKLAHGLQPAQIAQAHGVALSTVLTQVAAVRAKTMSTSIRQLLARLSRLPPLRPLLG